MRVVSACNATWLLYQSRVPVVAGARFQTTGTPSRCKPAIDSPRPARVPMAVRAVDYPVMHRPHWNAVRKKDLTSSGVIFDSAAAFKRPIISAIERLPVISSRTIKTP